ncbi:glycosyltransferase family 4 protein [Methanosphaera sp. ISO3-F5]|uniref:glycosyltransferase family 4 protein n=1 Tax=Methanosphaera sp. ISO3-F5 TaxID=1452353 RepID=UPI002B257BDB|nr:glycosyltransferase family 4 protein [Methanosphaera sp. ISO3-F5]WQH63408.1 glycosyltransferase family 4 protein [Methanosphaera sp. ISO3-F5]
MKICMVLEFFIPHYNGGGEHRYHEIAKRLVQQGHTVDLLTMKILNIPEYEDVDGINVHHIGPTIKKAPYRSATDFIQYFFAVTRWLLKHDYDVIDAQAYSPLLSSRIAARIKKTPLIGTIHDTSSNSNDQWIQSSKIANTMEKFLVNLNFDKILTVSHATKNSLINDFAVNSDKILMLYNGVDIAKYDAVHIDGVLKNNIIFVGRLAPHKHVDHLINSVNIIQEKIPDIKLTIVGKGEEKDKLIQMVNKLELEKNIKFKQDLTDEELITEIKKSELLVLPSTREGFGMVLAEANCCYKPVITYASGGTVEVVENGYNGFLIEPENIEDLTQKILETLENKELNQKLGQNGRKKVEKDFDWEKIVNQYINVLCNVIL